MDFVQRRRACVGTTDRGDTWMVGRKCCKIESCLGTQPKRTQGFHRSPESVTSHSGPGTADRAPIQTTLSAQKRLASRENLLRAIAQSTHKIRERPARALSVN